MNFTAAQGRLGMAELNEASAAITEAAHKDANVIWGVATDDSLGDKVKVTVIATDFEGHDQAAQQPAGNGFGANVQQSTGFAQNTGMRTPTFNNALQNNTDMGTPKTDFFTVNNIDIPVWMRK